MVLGAVAALFVVPTLVAGEPTLTDAQVTVLLADPGINASGLEEHSGPEEGMPENESCQKILAAETAHLRGYFNGSNKGSAATASTAWVGVLDSPAAVADMFALIGPCNTEIGGAVVTPVTVEAKGAWMEWKGKDDTTGSVGVRYGNILAIASGDTVPDPQAYLQALVTAVERARIG